MSAIAPGRPETRKVVQLHPSCPIHKTDSKFLPERAGVKGANLCPRLKDGRCLLGHIPEDCLGRAVS